jgi:hypothetical protein
MDNDPTDGMVRLEHERRIRSLPLVSNCGVPVIVRQPRWTWQQALRLLYLPGMGLITLGKRLTPEKPPLPCKRTRRRAGLPSRL